MGALAGLVFLVAYSIGTGLLAGPISQHDSLQAAAQTFHHKADSVVFLRDRVVPRWFVRLAAVLAVAMIGGAVALPLFRQPALLANLSVGIFFLVASLLVLARAGKVPA
jgi:hypothetical protein